jgi:septal ring factor EnvC (AmiA/AmiB activator)
MRGGLLVFGVVMVLPVMAGAQPARPAAAPAVKAPAPPDEHRALLHQLAEAQRALGDQLQQLRARVDGLHDTLASAADARTTLDEEVKAMRDEVKGLYWESSQVKQQIDALKEDLAGVNGNVSNFRTFSGFFIAVMILLLAVIFVMTIRR